MTPEIIAAKGIHLLYRRVHLAAQCIQLANKQIETAQI
jgi:hypothetical protein